MLDSILMFFKI